MNFTGTWYGPINSRRWEGWLIRFNIFFRQIKNKRFSIFLCSSEPKYCQFLIAKLIQFSCVSYNCISSSSLSACISFNNVPKAVRFALPMTDFKIHPNGWNISPGKTLNRSYTFILTCTVIIKFNIYFYIYIPLIYIYIPLMYQSWHCKIQQKEHHVLGRCL